MTMAVQAGTVTALNRSRQPVPAPRPDAVRSQCRAALGLFCCGVAVCWAGAPALLRYLFPAAAFLLAVFLFVRSRVDYLGFVLWLYFFSPFIRRMVDFRAGFMPVSPLLLAPFLATAVSGYVLVSRARSLGRPGALPFACALAGIFFGTVVGLTRYAPMEVGRAFLNWVPPVLFGFFLHEERVRYEEYQRAIARSMVAGTLCLAIYGVFQFFHLLPWDLQWMLDMNAGVFGQPEPMKVRAFGTMNAPALYAAYMMAGALLVFCLKSRLRPATVGLAFLALLFTSSRASWIGFAGGVVFLAVRLDRRARMQLLGSLLVCVLLIAAAALVPIDALRTMVSGRLQSLSDPSHDVSYNARIEGHAEALRSLASEPFGEGLGSTDTDHAAGLTDDRLGPHDSTMLECLYALGGPGTLIYLLGAGFGAMRVARAKLTEPFAIGMIAILVAFAAESMLNSVFVGVLGFMVWMAAGMSLAAAER